MTKLNRFQEEIYRIILYSTTIHFKCKLDLTVCRKMLSLITCTCFLHIKFIFSEGAEVSEYSRSLSIVYKGSFTQRVGEILLKFSAIHAKKWGVNRVSAVIINKLDILCMSF
jgi:hypothetical protein